MFKYIPLVTAFAIRVVRRLTNFNGRWKSGLSGQEYRIQLQAPNGWEIVANEWSYGLKRQYLVDWRTIIRNMCFNRWSSPVALTCMVLNPWTFQLWMHWNRHRLWDFVSVISDLKSLDFAVTRFLMKLFRTSNTEIIAECQHYFGFSHLSKLIERKRNKFVNNYKNVSLL